VTGTDGQPYALDGFKAIQDDPGQDVWKDTTTLFTTIYLGTTTEAPMLGRGILRMSWADFLQELASCRVHNASTCAAKQQALDTFGAFFFGELWEMYGKLHVPER
jgi:cholesterol oxidase